MDSGLNMIHSSEFDEISESGRFFCLARAYLDASRILCASFLTEDFSYSFSSTRVIMHLYRHSIELFLKGAIAHGSGNKSFKDHRLPRLIKEYNSLFPDPEYWFDVPFCNENTLLDDPAVVWHVPEELIEKYQKTLDQRYRYPIDIHGKPFDELEGFIPEMFMDESAQIRVEFLKLEKKIAGAIY